MTNHEKIAAIIGLALILTASIWYGLHKYLDVYNGYDDDDDYDDDYDDDDYYDDDDEYFTKVKRALNRSDWLDGQLIELAKWKHEKLQEVADWGNRAA